MSNLILITGTSKGIGRYLVDYYLKKGSKVIGCSRSEVTNKNENYHHYQLDIANEKSIKDMFLDIRKKYKNIDVLINNAGLASMNHVLLTPGEKAKQIIESAKQCAREARQKCNKIVVKKEAKWLNFNHPTQTTRSNNSK